MKQLETTEKIIGENTFYIRPFPAFTAANISGELTALFTPLLGALAPMFGDKKPTKADDVSNIMDADVETVVPGLVDAFSSLTGDKVERLLKKLLIQYNNISVYAPGVADKVTAMNMDIANEVFCGDVQDMYILCWEVIRINFKGFFKKIGGLFGNLQQGIQKKMGTSESTEISTLLSSRISK